ncbi:MAG: hypothetical protein J6S99_02800 [Bacteroidales bacterium]|nr:hypothetical protein [Bacteroidales bacterium]
MKRSFADIMAGLDSERAQKVARKLPAWSAVDGIEIPSALSLEQCSSSATARYKALVAGQVAAAARSGQLPPETSGCAGPLPSDDGPLPLTMPRVARFPGAVPASVPLATILDLTGGLGVDSWALSQVAERVVYFERNEELAAAAGRNFQRLGAGNIDVRCETVTPQTELPEADLIYADPARRDAAGRKVFLLEDCTPDILTLLPMLLRKAPAVLVKLSPMADLAMLAERFGPALREIHVVECDGEVKELLCLLLRDNSSPEPDILVVRLSGQAAGGDILRFRMAEERAAEVRFAAEVRPGDVLLEPCPALLKAGAFRLPCARWGLQKLAPSTHLYLLPGAETAPSAPGNPFFPSPGAETAPSAPGSRFFKAWRIAEVLPLGAAAFKALKQRYPHADVTARNLPLGSAELQKRLGVASGGDVHIFGCRLADSSPVLLVTEPV